MFVYTPEHIITAIALILVLLFLLGCVILIGICQLVHKITGKDITWNKKEKRFYLK